MRLGESPTAIVAFASLLVMPVHRPTLPRFLLSARCVCGRRLSTFSSPGRAVTAYKHCPFRPIFLQPVDMFPHTDHTELVASFERAPSAYGNLNKLVDFSGAEW